MSIKGKPTATPPLLKNVGTSPVIYFDGVPVFGTFVGNIEVNLAVRLLVPKSDGNITGEMSSVAHLRCSSQTALALADALTRAVDMLKKQAVLESAGLIN